MPDRFAAMRADYASYAKANGVLEMPALWNLWPLVFFVIGGSGCGKSTLLKHLIGLLPVAGIPPVASG